MLTLGQAVFWATRVVQWTKESPLPYKFPILTLSLDSKNVFPTWHLQLIPKAMIVFAPQLFLPGVSCHRWRHTIHPFLLATNLQAMIQLQLVNIHIYEQNGWCLTWKVLNIRDLKKKKTKEQAPLQPIIFILFLNSYLFHVPKRILILMFLCLKTSYYSTQLPCKWIVHITHMLNFLWP